MDIIEEWAPYIRELNPKPERVVFCENNSTDGTLNKIVELDVGAPKDIIRFWTVDPTNKEVIPFTHCYDVIAHARQLLLTKARHLDPDYAIFIDSDVFLMDPTAIDSLTIWQKDLIGGAYSRVFPEGLFLATLFYSSVRKEKVKMWSKYKKLPGGVPLIEVHATSGGCLCLSRKLIQDRRVNFYPITETYSEDFGYCKNARDNGYKVYLDGTLLLGHKILAKWRAWDVVRQEGDERAEDFDHGTMIERIKKGVAEYKAKKAAQKKANT